VNAHAPDGGAAIVTGAGQGIGRAYALRLAADGWPVLVVDVDAARAASVESAIAGAGGRATACVADVSNEADCDRMAERALDAYGGIGALVNNAAVFSNITPKPFWELTVAEWDGLMSVNLKGMWLASKAVTPVMRRKRAGSILNISSASNFMGRPNYAHYVTSKAGVIGLTRAMARELGPDGVRVNCLAPGGVVTEVERKTMTGADLDGLVAAQSVKRPATPNDLVGYVAFILSPQAAFITGQTLVIDGGLIMH
jgi:3-oxoacyl-[acyl-carrier protein] reductase